MMSFLVVGTPRFIGAREVEDESASDLGVFSDLQYQIFDEVDQIACDAKFFLYRRKGNICRMGFISMSDGVLPSDNFVDFFSSVCLLEPIFKSCYPFRIEIAQNIPYLIALHVSRPPILGPIMKSP